MIDALRPRRALPERASALETPALEFDAPRIETGQAGRGGFPPGALGEVQIDEILDRATHFETATALGEVCEEPGAFPAQGGRGHPQQRFGQHVHQGVDLLLFGQSLERSERGL